LRARSHARDGNEQYRAGEYAKAVLEYEQAEQLYDELPVVALNKGLTCRQMMVPGSKAPESQKATDCALAAFSKLQKLNPDDPRGEQLYTQTLFDGDRYETLVATYEEQLRKKPNDLLAINALIQVYTRWNKPEEALKWTVKRAESQPKDADAQYSVGVAMYYQLMQGGGGADKASYNPFNAPQMPPPPKKRARKKELEAYQTALQAAMDARPKWSVGDIMGAKRVALADSGITYLKKALELRPSYREALVYLNLIHRQRAFAFLDRPEEWQKDIDAAVQYQQKAMAGMQPQGAAATNPAPAADTKAGEAAAPAAAK
jgi:hypothetical protein